MAFARERIAKRIMLKVALMLRRDLNDPRLGLVTVTRVQLSKDRRECQVYWSTLAEGGARSAMSHALEDARGFVQKEVARVLHVRNAPRLHFCFDPALEGAERLSHLIKEAREEDRRAQRARASRESDSPAPPGSPASGPP